MYICVILFYNLDRLTINEQEIFFDTILSDISVWQKRKKKSIFVVYTVIVIVTWAVVLT